MTSLRCNKDLSQGEVPVFFKAADLLQVYQNLIIIIHLKTS